MSTWMSHRRPQRSALSIEKDVDNAEVVYAFCAGSTAACTGAKASIGIETGPMTPWLVHELRLRGLDATCLDARHARAVLRMQYPATAATRVFAI
jgi:hypothetical protein